MQFARGVNEEAPTELYTWYEEAVISDVQDDLQEQYGWSTKYISTLLSSGGLAPRDAGHVAGLVVNDGDGGLEPLAALFGHVVQVLMGGLTQGVSTREMANAYATFPNMGIYRRARTYTVVKDSNGNILLDNTREDEPALTGVDLTELRGFQTAVEAVGEAGQAADGGELLIFQIFVDGGHHLFPHLRRRVAAQGHPLVDLVKAHPDCGGVIGRDPPPGRYHQ